jgi:hypothetical protein
MVGLTGPAGSGKSRSATRVASGLHGNVVPDFTQHLRVIGQRAHIPAKSMVIVKDMLALHFAQLRPRFDLSIYLEAPDEVCFRRRPIHRVHPASIREYRATGGCGGWSFPARASPISYSTACPT